MRWTCIPFVLLAALHAPAAAQTVSRPVWKEASPSAQQQIHQVENATAPLATPDSARAAGFTPVLGWIPTMGTHWVNGPRMLQGRTFDVTSPSQLMFSRVNGQETLVGAAYAYFAPLTDSTRPNSFDGNPGWHEHADLAPPGTTLVMLHVWLVPSPDGPFAGHNPYLPFWALGLTPPSAERMKDEGVSRRTRRAALALAEVADTAGVFPVVARRPAVRPVLVEHRDSINALIPKLDAAQKKGDWRAWDRIADQLGAQWDAVREAYLKSVVNPYINARMVKFLDGMEASGHGMEHHR